MKNLSTIHKTLRTLLSTSSQAIYHGPNAQGPIKDVKPYEVVKLNFTQLAAHDEEVPHEEIDGFISLIMMNMTDWDIAELIMTTSLAKDLPGNLPSVAYNVAYQAYKAKVRDMLSDFKRFSIFLNL